MIAPYQWIDYCAGPLPGVSNYEYDTEEPRPFTYIGFGNRHSGWWHTNPDGNYWTPR